MLQSSSRYRFRTVYCSYWSSVFLCLVTLHPEQQSRWLKSISMTSSRVNVSANIPVFVPISSHLEFPFDNHTPKVKSVFHSGTHTHKLQYRSHEFPHLNFFATYVRNFLRPSPFPSSPFRRCLRYTTIVPTYESTKERKYARFLYHRRSPAFCP